VPPGPRLGTATGAPRRFNPAHPGFARELLTAQNFGQCGVHGVGGATGVKAIANKGLPYTITCGYGAAAVKGTASNVGQVNKFTDQTFTLLSGSSACPKKGNFSAKFGPVKDTSVKNHPARLRELAGWPPPGSAEPGSAGRARAGLGEQRPGRPRSAGRTLAAHWPANKLVLNRAIYRPRDSPRRGGDDFPYFCAAQTSFRVINRAQKWR
jgi:hypothetical protein